MANCCDDEICKSNVKQDGENHINDDHNHDSSQGKTPYTLAAISFLLLLLGIIFEHIFKFTIFNKNISLIWYSIAYLTVGFPVMREGFEAALKRDFFNEFTLMSVATIGAFALGQYAEGVAVMLFYAIGELFQNAAINKAKGDIKSLLDVRPQIARVLQDNAVIETNPNEVAINDIVQVLAGEKVPLDGELLSENGSFNSIALTGESVPRQIKKGESLLAGMINLNNVIELKVTKKFADSSISRIIELVENAATRKAPTELFIRKFAKIYTPIVFFLALALVISPKFFMADYVFNDWLYRALVFLVISCPCALVISIPLGYFGGIGAGSKNGILFKGGNYLDLMVKLNTLVLDKTGTLTEGVFAVREIKTQMNEAEFLSILCTIEHKSTHPIAKAIVDYAKGKVTVSEVNKVNEISGHGLQGQVKGKEILVGNGKLLKKFGVEYPKEIDEIVQSIVLMAIDNQFAGYVIVADAPKEDAKSAIASLTKLGLKDIFVLSGDKSAITKEVATRIGINNAFGDLLPEDKVKKIEELKQDKSRIIAFVGDGINDAPALALADVGIAMGGLGADAAIETADVIIQTDQPSKIATAIAISKATKNVVWQNIAFAFGIKIIVLILGAGGMASMWEAVFADVGVALIAIFNAVRIQKMRFSN
ncbi:heavy metal translocating P-type ATPase [Pseudaquidulcibacter saccharophilus]|uniref:heavy metal translocating P-type ATPase n=1 Tax=Pseudaquidulcibacter saccharophilus TaxID=2831900 RepID=UPI001EFF143E|nr:heavy metal translocating P-type ATPase [Pseudaquidulcibacter saccharophilus]